MLVCGQQTGDEPKSLISAVFPLPWSGSPGLWLSATLQAAAFSASSTATESWGSSRSCAISRGVRRQHWEHFSNPWLSIWAFWDSDGNHPSSWEECRALIQHYFNALAPLETDFEQSRHVWASAPSAEAKCVSAERGLFLQPCSLLGPCLPWLTSRRKMRILLEKREREARITPGIGSERAESHGQTCQEHEPPSIMCWSTGNVVVVSKTLHTGMECLGGKGK